MKVQLIAHTPNPQRLCAAAAKICHEPDDSDFEDYNMTVKTVERLLRYVIKKGHESVLEHASFTFIIEDVSRAMTHQLVRHRIASYSQQSQRFVKMKEPTFVVPDSIENSKGYVKNQYYAIMQDIWAYYKNMTESSNIPPEDARFVLPNACTTKIVVTMNARSLRNFFRLRLNKHAQWEIRATANEMLKQVMEVAPLLFEDVVHLSGDYVSMDGD